MTNDLKHLLAQLRIEKCVLIGHSMGGKTAMATALMQVSCREKSPHVCHDSTVPPLDVTWPLSLYIWTYTSSDLCFQCCLFSCLLTPIYLSLFVAWFSGEVGGGRHQSSPDNHTHQLPLLHPGHAGDEDFQWHPTLHRQADGWRSAAQFGQGQDSFLSWRLERDFFFTDARKQWVTVI